MIHCMRARASSQEQHLEEIRRRAASSLPDRSEAARLCLSRTVPRLPRSLSSVSAAARGRVKLRTPPCQMSQLETEAPLAERRGSFSWAPHPSPKRRQRIWTTHTQHPWPDCPRRGCLGWQGGPSSRYHSAQCRQRSQSQRHGDHR